MEYWQTATSTARHALQLPDDDPESTSVDLLLEDKDYPTISVGIGQLIRRERHADVYSAYWRPGGVIVIISEARAFILEGVAAKLRRHRKRCMQRLKPRTLATTSLRGAEIIVYETSSRAYIQDEDSVSNEPSPSLFFQKRTLNYKREPARIQPARPRRRKNAFDEQGLVAYIRALNAELNRDNISMAPDLLDAFRAAVLLYIFFDKKGNRRSAEPPYVPEGCISSSKPTTLYFLLRSLSVLETPGLRPGERQSHPHENDWMLYEMRQQLEDLKTQLFNMSYRELSMGVDSFLSTLSSSDLRSVQSRNHQFGLLQHIRITLPILIQSYPEIPHEYAFWWSSLPENKDVLYLLFLTILGTTLGLILIDYISKYIF